MATPMTSDRELWALTLKVEHDHGDDAPRHIAEKIGQAAVVDDRTAIDMWKAVAVRLHQLLKKPAGW